MSMTGVIANTLTVIIGSLVGLTFRKGIPEKVTSAVMTGLGLCSIYIGIDGALSGENVLIVIAAMVVGSIIGTLLDIDQAINNLGTWVENRYSNNNKGQVSITQGFVTASLLFCVGAMTIIGSLNDGLTGDSSVLFVKSALDFVSSIILGATLGFGVIFSAIPILLYQGGITLLAGALSGVLQGELLEQICFVGYAIIIAIGFNFILEKKFRTLNMVPAILLPVVYHYILMLINYIKQ